MGIRGFSVLTALLASAIAPVALSESIKGYLIMSAPRNSRIAWIKMPESGSFEGLQPQTLIDSGLQHPQGIAIDQKRKRLYVADPDVQKIYSYQLVASDGVLTTDGRQTVVSQNCESRWVSVDGVGNVFFSDEPQNLIMKLSADKVLRGTATPEVVYNGNSVSQVSKPGGIAVDNFHVYWTNKHFGSQVGSVIRAPEFPESSSATPSGALSVLGKNSVKSYGVCLAMGNVFYTDDHHSIFGVKKSGGHVSEVSHALNRPRGCVWDGDGTVFVADRGASAIFSFAGNMHQIGHTEIRKSFEFEDAFGLAVLSSGALRSWSELWTVFFAVSALALLRA